MTRPLRVASSNIPDSVRQLIHEHIPSVERLEILLLLFEARTRPWTVEAIEERIRSTPESIRTNVSALVGEHFVVVSPSSLASPRFQFQSDPPALDEAVAALAIAYRTHRVAVIELIYSERHESVRSFSNAFKLGKPHGR